MRHDDLEERIVTEEPLRLEEDTTLLQFCEMFGINPTEARKKLKSEIHTSSEERRPLMVPGEVVEEFKRCFMEAGSLFWNEEDGASKPTYSQERAAIKLEINKSQLAYLINRGIQKKLLPFHSEEIIVEDGFAKIPSLGDLPYGFLPRIPVSAVRVWHKLNRDRMLEKTVSGLQEEYTTKSREEDRIKKIASNPEGYPLYNPTDNFVPEPGKKYFHDKYGVFTVLELQSPSENFPNKQFNTFIAEFENRETKTLVYNLKPRRTVK